jgi:hypothetical protein
MGRKRDGFLVQFRYTHHQVARGSRPDGQDRETAHLVKNVLELRLTYQVRLLTFLAQGSGKRLLISIPRSARISRDMRAFLEENKATVKVRRFD